MQSKVLRISLTTVKAKTKQVVISSLVVSSNVPEISTGVVNVRSNGLNRSKSRVTTAVQSQSDSARSQIAPRNGVYTTTLLKDGIRSRGREFIVCQSAGDESR